PKVEIRTVGIGRNGVKQRVAKIGPTLEGLDGKTTARKGAHECQRKNGLAIPFPDRRYVELRFQNKGLSLFAVFTVDVTSLLY
ncbi:MAG: hypothetical protein Q4E55_07275, partial [Bacteroidales bacterium]|nr:hypothetical protein [Bacteroidales bacterium]